MANNTALPSKDLPDRELALWLIDRMQASEEFLAVIQAARAKGQRDVLDTPDYVAEHKARVRKLFDDGSDDEPADVPPSLAGKIEAIMARDMISGVEEFLEKAIAAYIEKHPLQSQGLPEQWRTTVEAARAEVEGRTDGAFAPGFTASLAASARAEIDRRLARDQDREAGRDIGRDSRD